jgi:hypothetical protein
MALASGFYAAIELWVLTHNHKKIRMALASDFSIAKEQVLLTPAMKPIFRCLWSRRV